MKTKVVWKTKDQQYFKNKSNKMICAKISLKIKNNNQKLV